MRVGVVRFPGSTGAEDAVFAFSSILGCETKILTHRTEQIRDIDLLILPGGASFGDHLRPGALTRITPIAAPIRRFARTGKVLGIGNGFQVLCELGILGGALLQNPKLRFYQGSPHIRFTPGKSFLKLDPNTVLSLPTACYAGRYFGNGRTRRDNEEQQLIIGRYCSPDGTVDEELTVNESIDNVSTLTNGEGNVIGMIAHPERAIEEICGSTDGLTFLKGILAGCTP